MSTPKPAVPSRPTKSSFSVLANQSAAPAAAVTSPIASITASAAPSTAAVENSHTTAPEEVPQPNVSASTSPSLITAALAAKAASSPSEPIASSVSASSASPQFSSTLSTPPGQTYVPDDSGIRGGQLPTPAVSSSYLDGIDENSADFSSRLTTTGVRQFRTESERSQEEIAADAPSRKQSSAHFYEGSGIRGGQLPTPAQYSSYLANASQEQEMDFTTRFDTNGVRQTRTESDASMMFQMSTRQSNADVLGLPAFGAAAAPSPQSIFVAASSDSDSDGAGTSSDSDSDKDVFEDALDFDGEEVHVPPAAGEILSSDDDSSFPVQSRERFAANQQVSVDVGGDRARAIGNAPPVVQRASKPVLRAFNPAPAVTQMQVENVAEWREDGDEPKVETITTRLENVVLTAVAGDKSADTVAPLQQASLVTQTEDVSSASAMIALKRASIIGRVEDAAAPVVVADPIRIEVQITPVTVEGSDVVQVSMSVDSFLVDSSVPESSTATALASAAPAAAVPAPLSSSRQYLISHEISTTEHRFITSMRNLHEAFIAPAEIAAMKKDQTVMGQVVLDTRVQVFFAMASQILKLNVRFLRELDAVMTAWAEAGKHQVEPPEHVSTVGAVFLNYASLFKIFSAYAKDHELVSSLLISSGQVKGSAMEKYILQVQAEGRLGGQTMESLLIAPVQRVPRYILLLSELKRKSSPQDRGYPELLLALGEVSSVASHINETIRQREQNEVLKKIEERFTSGGSSSAASSGGVLSPSKRAIDLRDKNPPRTLIREGLLSRLTRKGKTSYYFHLFNDCLLYSEEIGVSGVTGSSVGKTKYLKLHRKVNFEESCAVTDKSVVPPQGKAAPAAENPAGESDAKEPPRSPTNASSTSSSPAAQYAIEVRSPAKSFIVLFPNQEEKDAWLQDIQTCIACIRADQEAASGNIGGGAVEFVAPVWTQDQLAAKCGICEKAFTLFNRRHHCRSCGAVCCSACSNHRRMLPSVDQTKPVRVCETCVRTAHEQGKAARGVSVSMAGNGASTSVPPINPLNAPPSASTPIRQHRPSGISALLARPTGALSPSSSTSNRSVSPGRIREPSVVSPGGGAGATEGAAVGAGGTTQSIREAEDGEESGDAVPEIRGSMVDSEDADVNIPPYRRALFSLAHAYRGDERLYNAMELYLSEITYCKELEVLLSHFVEPLLKQITTGKKSMLSNQSSTQLLGKNVSPTLLIFLSSIQPLYTLGRELHKVLHAKIISGEDPSSTSPAQSAASAEPSTNAGASTTSGGGFRPVGWNPDRTTFGEVFLRYAHLFDLYVEFAQTHKQALSILTDPNEIFAKEVFQRYDTGVRARMAEIHEEQQQVSHAAKRREPQWLKHDEAAAARAGKAAEPQVEPTPMSTETVEDVDQLLASRNKGSLYSPRMSMSGRLSLGQQPVILDEPPTHTSLHDLLASPFMRVSKYVWLLSSLLRATPEGHPDNMTTGPNVSQRQLSSALTAVQQSLNHINAAILVGDNLARLTVLQEKFVGSSKELDLVAPSRHLLKEGFLLRQTRKGATSYYFHLLSDLLIYSEVTVGGKYKIHRKLPLITVQVLDTGASDTSLEIHSPVKSFVIIAPSPAEKEEWLEQITLAVKAEEKRTAFAAATLSPTAAATTSGAPIPASSSTTAAAVSQHRDSLMQTAPLWTKDSDAEVCPFCSKKFNFLNRRHHCRMCGSVCCAACSGSTRLIESLDKKPVRVCNSCAAKP